MTVSLFNKWNTPNNFSNTLIHRTHRYNLLLRNPTRMAPYPSWTLVWPDLYNTLTTTVYRKPTTQYLHWDSNHSISSQNCVFNTSANRARVICTNQSSLQQEITISDKHYQHVSSTWALNSLLLKFNHKHNIRGPHTATNGVPSTTNNTDSNNKNLYMIVQYIRGPSTNSGTIAIK